MSHPCALTPPIAGAHAVKLYSGFGILGADIPTSGDHGASPVLNDGISPTAEYHWRVETSPSSGVLTIYPDMSFEWDSSGAANGTYTFIYRLYENGQDQGTATVDIVLGAITLAIAEALHAHTADNETLDTSNATWLTIQTADHAHAADAVVLSIVAALAIAEATHQHAAEQAVLSSEQVLAIAESLHNHWADIVVLSLSSAGSGNCPTADEIATAVWAYVSRSMPSAERDAIATAVWNKTLPRPRANNSFRYPACSQELRWRICWQ